MVVLDVVDGLSVVVAAAFAMLVVVTVAERLDDVPHQCAALPQFAQFWAD